MGVVHAKNILKWGGAKNIYTQGQRGSKRNSLFIFGIDGTCDTEKGLLLISIINNPFHFRVFPACLISIKPHTYPFHLPHQKEMVCKKYANRNLTLLVRSASLYGTSYCKVQLIGILLS